MKMSGRIGTKVLAALLCQCMVLSMVSMNAQAATVDDNPATKNVDISDADDVMGKNYGIVNTNNGTVKENNGTVNFNNGTVEKNKINGAVVSNDSMATVQENEGAVTENYGSVMNNYGSVRNNYGSVEKNFGTVTNVTENGKTGTVKEEFRKIDIVGSNYDLKGDVGNANNASWAIIKEGNVITLIANPGYHFSSVPTSSDDSCSITESGNNYQISGIPDAPEPLVITLNIVKDTNPTKDSNNNDDNNYDYDNDTATIETPDPYVVFLQTQTTKVTNAKTGETVLIESDSYQSYPTAFMKTLLERRDITVKMSYNYKGMHYEVVIPKNHKFVLDEKIPWYGPLKLAEMFGAVITPIVQ